jgi:hypothetical protein
MLCTTVPVLITGCTWFGDMGTVYAWPCTGDAHPH